MQIYGTSFGAVEECGNTTSSETHLMPGDFTVVFRTSEDDVVGDGFELYVTCYRPGEAMPGNKKRSYGMTCIVIFCCCGMVIMHFSLGIFPWT